MVPASVSASGSVISSAAKPATVGSTDRGVATVERPAPARSAAIPAMAAAPDFPSEPPMMSTCPKFPLFASTARGAKQAWMSGQAITSRLSFDWIASAGEPIRPTTISPRVRSPKTCAGRGAVKVTMASARQRRCSSGAKASALAPEGMSTASTGTGDALIKSMAAANSPATGGLKPVPRRASRMRSACAVALAGERAPPGLSSCSERMIRGAIGSCFSMAAASPLTSAGSPSSRTSTFLPASWSLRAATKPSPPLLPFPQTTQIRWAGG